MKQLYICKVDGNDQQLTREQYIATTLTCKNVEFQNQVICDGIQRQLIGEEITGLYEDIESAKQRMQSKATKLPTWPETINVPYEKWFRQLNQAINTQPIAKIQTMILNLQQETDAMEKCEFHGSSGGPCGCIAVSVVFGIKCCSEHAKIRARYFGA